MQNNRFTVKQQILHNILQKWQEIEDHKGKNFPIFEVRDIGYARSKQGIDKWLDQYINSQK